MGDSRVDVRRVGMRGDVRGTAADIDRRAERVAGVLTNHSRDHGSSDPSKEEESRDDRTTTKTARARAEPRRSLTTGSAKITRTGPGTGRPASGGARRGRQ